MASEKQGGLYYEGVEYVLGGDDHWSKLDAPEQASLRSKRAKAGVKCDQCGLVGYFRRNCPTCSKAIIRERDKRRLPKILPVFLKYTREFGLWATKVMNLARDLKTNELTRSVGMIRIRRFSDEGFGNEDDKFTDRFEPWLLKSESFGDKLNRGGKLDPTDLETALHGFHGYYSSVDDLAKHGMGLRRQTREKNFFWRKNTVPLSDAVSSVISKKSTPNQPPEKLSGSIDEGGEHHQEENVYVPPTPPLEKHVEFIPTEKKFGVEIGGADDYVMKDDKVVTLSVEETIEHYRTSRNRGVNNGILSPSLLRCVNCAVDETSSATEGSGGADEMNTMENERPVGFVAKTTNWTDGRSTSFPHGSSSAHKGLAQDGERHPMIEADDPRRRVDGGAQLVQRAIGVTDRGAESFAALPFKPRNSIEQNFQAVLRRLSEIAQSEIEGVKPQAHSILRPPKVAVHARFFPDGVWEEHRDYLSTLNEKSEQQSHGYRGHGVPSDNVVYFGDREPVTGTHGIARRRAQVKSMYEAKKAPLVSSHTAVSWVSVLAQQGKHAPSGRDTEIENIRLNRALEEQSSWVPSQHALSVQREQRCQHLLALLREEMEKDAKREAGLLELKVSKREIRKRMVDLAKQRAEASDRIMRILQEYGMLSGDEAADYYQYTLGEVDRATKHPNESEGYQALRKQVHVEKVEPGGLKDVHVYVSSKETYKPVPVKANAKTFKKAGLEQTVRCGNVTEHTTLPALVSFPNALHTVNDTGGDGLGSSANIEALARKHNGTKAQHHSKHKHKKNKGPPPPPVFKKSLPDKYSGDGNFPREEGSYLASKIMQGLREKQPINPRTGRVVPQDIYLPTRVTDAPADPPGSRIFSASMGRALGKFLPERDQPKYTQGAAVRRRRAARELATMEATDD